jgi:hypothetical protein
MVRCPACQKAFASNNSLEKHLKKKIPCTGKLTHTTIEVTERPALPITDQQIEKHLQEITNTQKQLDEPLALEDAKALLTIVDDLNEKLPKNVNPNVRKLMENNEQFMRRIIRDKFTRNYAPIEDVQQLTADLASRIRKNNPKLNKETVEKRAKTRALQRVKKQLDVYDEILEKKKDPLKAGQAVFRERKKAVKKEKLSTREFQMQMELIRLQQMQYEHLQREAEAKAEGAKVDQNLIEYQREQERRVDNARIAYWAENTGAIFSALTGFAFWRFGNPFGSLAFYLQNVGRFAVPEAITLPFINHTLSIGWWFKEGCQYGTAALNWVIPKFALLAKTMSGYWVASAGIITVLVGLLTWLLAHFIFRVMYAKEISVGGVGLNVGIKM